MAEQSQREQIREALSEEHKSIFDRLVNEYKFQALRLHGHPFVSYKVLGALVEEGWVPSDALPAKTYDK